MSPYPRPSVVVSVRVRFMHRSSDEPSVDDRSLRMRGRTVYGRDAAGYDRGRPDYPEHVYRVLRDRCGLRRGARVLECGPGTGRLTRHLLEAGASVTAVEPDPEMTRYLARALAGADLDVQATTFEEATLRPGSFDLVVAATSFHWVDPTLGWAKLGQLVAPGGWAALVWTVFGDLTRPDPFDEATSGLLGLEPGDQVRNTGFALDEAARRADLTDRAGLTGVECEQLHWTFRMDPEAVRAFYGSLMIVRTRPAPDREVVLERLEQEAVGRFHGVVERPFVTALYTARRPS